MTRNLKLLVTMLLATTLTMSALSVSTASAEEAISAYFLSSVGGGETAKIDGSQIETTTFTLGSQSVTCSSATLNGQALTSGEESTEIKLEPKYENCHAVILGVKKPATFTMNGCYYNLNATATITEEGRGIEYPADLKIECPAEKQIEVHVYENEKEEKVLCTYDIKSQGSLSGISITNKESDVIADISTTGIAVTNTKPSFLCGVSESGTATYKGESTLRATNAGSEYVQVKSKAPKRFRFGTGKAVATGNNGTAELKTEKGTIKCTSHYEATPTSMFVKELSVKPTYTNCTAFAGLTADVNFEGCEYLQTLDKGTYTNGTGGGETHTTGLMSITCPALKAVEITLTEGGKFKCTVTVVQQTPPGVVDLKNKNGTKPAEDFVLFTNTLQMLGYLVTGSPGTCGENGEVHTAELLGSINVPAYEDLGGNPAKLGNPLSFQVIGEAAP